jgi:hypothetical protein
MAKKKPSAFDLLKTKEELTSLLDNFSDLVSSGTADVRAQVLELIPAFYLLRKLGTNILPEGDSVGARKKVTGITRWRTYPLLNRLSIFS